MRTLLRTAQGWLLKGDEGGTKFGGGVAENGDFRQGGHYPWVILALRVTGIVPLLLSDPSTQRLMNGPSPNKDSSGKISGFGAAAASAAFLSAVFRPAASWLGRARAR